MKCIAHPTLDASGQCNNCNVALCGECVTRFDPPLCEKCFTEHNKSVAFNMYKGLAITAILFAVGLYFAISNDLGKNDGSGYIIMPLIFGFGYWGWLFLTDHAPRLTKGGGGVWVVYLTLKIVLSVVIGFIVGPYQIYKMVRELYFINKDKKGIN